MSTLLRASDIAQEIELATPAALASFKDNGIAERTRTAMMVFGDLGLKLGFQVACKKCDYANATFSGYLYDQYWYKEHPQKPGFVKDSCMALESEFSESEPGIDDDFAKLLQARVAVRIWLWQSVDARKHIDLYKDQIREFRYTLPGDEWVFGVYDWIAHKPLIERFAVTQADCID